MTIQSSLFDAPPAQRHSETSVQAARQIKGHAPAQRAEVFAFILQCGERGATDGEISDGLKMSGSSARPRRIELVESGVVIKSGLTRLSPSGRRTTVWVTK